MNENDERHCIKIGSSIRFSVKRFQLRLPKSFPLNILYHFHDFIVDVAMALNLYCFKIKIKK